MTAEQLCRRTRITQRELQWWTATGVIAPTRTTARREFDEAQALTAAIVAELRYKGVSLHRIRGLGIGQPLGDYLVVHAKMAVWCGVAGVISCAAACSGPCLVVSVEDLKRRLYDQDPPRFSRRKAN